MAEIYRVQTQITGVSGAPYFNQVYWPVLNLASVQNAIESTDELWQLVAPGMSQNATITIEGEVPVVETSSGQVIRVETGDPQTLIGTSGVQTELPNATQGLVRLRTGVYRTSQTEKPRSREVRGRVFVPAIGTTLNNDGRPSAGLVAALTAFAEGAASRGMHVYSPTHSASFPVIGGNGWSEFAVLRSRRD